MAAKPVPQYVLNTRAANKILNILAAETDANRAAILGFVTSSVGDLPSVQPTTDPRQAPLPFVEPPPSPVPAHETTASYGPPIGSGRFA